MLDTHSPTATAAKSKAKPKAKPGPRGPAGPKGATGATGATGPAGPTGPAGAAGAKGENGANGSNGSTGEPGAPGAPGTSATSKSFVGSKTKGSEKCEDGGSEVTSVSGTTLVCNGTTGFTEFLPAGKTETGTWTSAIGTAEQTTELMAISFPIPLEEPILERNAIFVPTSAQEGKIGSGAGEACAGDVGTNLSACEELFTQGLRRQNRRTDGRRRLSLHLSGVHRNRRDIY